MAGVVEPVQACRVGTRAEEVQVEVRGRDGLVTHLRQVSPEYLHFERLKVGPGRTVGYRPADAGAIQTLRERGGIVRARGSHDVDERLDAWRETPRLPTADVKIDTSKTEPKDAARRIDRVVRSVI